MVRVLKIRMSLLASRELPANGNRQKSDHAAGDMLPQELVAQGVINRRGAIGM
jgi:hypothetical protein